MDRNFLLAVSLSFLVLVLWSMLNSPPPPPPGSEGAQPTPQAQTGQSPGATDPGAAPATGPGAAPPSFDPGPAPSPPAAGVVGQAPTPVVVPDAAEQRVVIESDLWIAELTSHGGGLVRFELLEYEDASREGRPNVDLATLEPGGAPALATPFQELGAGDLSRAAYAVSQPDPYTVVFTRQQDTVVIRKTYSFDPESYLWRLNLDVENGTNRYLRSTFRVLWPASSIESADFREFQLAAFTDVDGLDYFPVVPGPSFLGFGGGTMDAEITLPETRPAELSWAGAQMRYFVSAILPELPREASARMGPVRAGQSGLLQVAYQHLELPPGQRADREYRIYTGPKYPDRLDAVGSHLDEAILKGWFPWLTRFFANALESTYSVVGNYGVAIILITIVVRLLMAPIMARQMKSMKRLSKLQPRIKELQEKYPDDRQKQSEAMMQVYKEEGVSPFSAMTGCLPMLLQLPVFIGFYYALQGAIQLRQQPFFGWMDDLSEPETLFVVPGIDLPVRLLPLLMGGSMVLQQKLTPTAMDPAQARMMLTIMPIMFTVLFYQFASGLVLYWLVSNLLGIVQQYITNRAKD
ncbi:MAG: membrane protein insertase YidC [Myxococcota bacterium]|nr:membrane protein insertase YidC [Myxococcota bacterium]